MRVAVEMVEEGLNTKEEAIMKLDPKQLDALLHPAPHQLPVDPLPDRHQGLAHVAPPRPRTVHDQHRPHYSPH